ncbi:MAG: ABC transporter permease [Candidatus Latescibacteria bacterium]|nr:ABC transporter permease [Candidatus Latescibacterota bacterium]
MLRIAVPYGMVAIGGCLSERSGVINIALEGILLNSAFGAAVGTIATGSPLAGVLCGILAGAATAALHALVTVTGKADQIVSGLSINIASLAGTRALLKIFYESASNSPRILEDPLSPLPGFDRMGPLGEVIGNPLFLVCAAFVVVADRILRRSGVGLLVRSAGERPAALDAAGGSVGRVRTLAVIAGGAVAGLGGVWLAFQQNSFTHGMSGGRGYIALAAMIAGKWRPVGAVAACLLFALAETLQIRASGRGIPTQFLQMLPYVAALAVLAGWVGRAVAPAAIGRPYRRGEEER